MLYYTLVTIYVINCFVLVLIVLLQQGKGGDIASAFGGGASQAAFGVRSGATVLTRATVVCATIFILGALVLTMIGQGGGGGGSVLGGQPTPQQQAPVVPQPAPAPTPQPEEQPESPTP